MSNSSLSSPPSSSSIQPSGQGYRNFIQALSSPFTQQLYKSHLKLYMQYRKATECEQLLQGDPRLIQSQIIDYVIHVREENKITGYAIQTILTVLKKFYDMNDVELKWKKINSYMGPKKKKKANDRPYTYKEIYKMLENADQRERVVVLLMASSGIRIGALPLLKIRNLQKIDKYSLYKITVYENESEEYITFCTPECRAVIDSYLDYRQRSGERIRDDAPLIREEFDINDEIHAARPRQLSVEVFKTLIKRLGHISGVIERKTTESNENNPFNTRAPRIRREVKQTHGFRKFFETTAITAGIAPLYVSMLMGHNSGLELASYFKPSEKDLLEGNDKMIGYAGIIDALTINEENRLRKKVEILTLNRTKLEARLDRLEELYESLQATN